MRHINIKYLFLGIVIPTEIDSIATANRRPRLAPYDNYLRKFRASAALDAAFTSAVKRRQPDIVLALFKELSRRQMLKQALAGRDDLSLLKILRYLNKHIAHTTYMPTLIEVTNIISQLYEFSSINSDKSQKSMEKLQKTISDELQYQFELMETKGIIEIILAAATTSTTPTLEVNCSTSKISSNGTVTSTS